MVLVMIMCVDTHKGLQKAHNTVNYCHIAQLGWQQT